MNPNQSIAHLFVTCALFILTFNYPLSNTPQKKWVFYSIAMQINGINTDY